MVCSLSRSPATVPVFNGDWCNEMKVRGISLTVNAVISGMSIFNSVNGYLIPGMRDLSLSLVFGLFQVHRISFLISV